MSTGTPGDASNDTGQVPNQLAILVPTFDPSVDNVETWISKVELLLLTWPSSKIRELATRLVLGCQGTALQKLQLHRDEVLINDPKGIKRIAELVGGKWGAIPLEKKKFDIVEKALFRGAQKTDESSDSYLSRNDVIWTESISKKTQLSEIQAYILLRGIRLNSEDKKRVLVDSGAEQGNALTVKGVEAAVRMIGSGFFQDMIGGKRDKNQKTCDHTAFTVDESHEGSWEMEGDVFWATDDSVLDDATLESMAADDDDDDEDAALVLQFEDAISEVVQGDKELCALCSSYQDARKRLSEKVRFRGFWSVKKGEKGSGKKGKVKGKGKSSLSSRITNSYCPLCLKKGHWKNECPSRSGGNSAPSTASTVPTSCVTAVDLSSEVQAFSVIEDQQMSCTAVPCCVSYTHQIFEKILDKKLGNQVRGSRDNQWPCGRNMPTSSTRDAPVSQVRSALAGPFRRNQRQHKPSPQVDAECPSLFASAGSIGVVDLGASQTVIGSQQVPQLLNQIPEWVRKDIKRKHAT